MNASQFLKWCTTCPDWKQPSLSTQQDAYSAKFAQSRSYRSPRIMGILNITHDSFYDGGRYRDLDQACLRVEAMIQEGVDLIDIGGESSRPEAQAISLDEELSRIIPVIERIRQFSDICISIDTCKAPVMREAVLAGATLINDINALRGQNALSTAAELNVPVCLMHMQGTPETMQIRPYYGNDVIHEISDFFHERIHACLHAGIARENLLLDPGFGFGKSVEHNLLIVKRLAEFECHQLPLLLGVSRKSTIGHILQKPVQDRLYGSLALTMLAALHGVAILRTHDIFETKQVLQMLEAVRQQ